MVQLFELFDKELFDKMLSEKYITVRPHNTLPLSIANYTPSAQYEQKWNEVTLTCRGLIFNNHTLEIVARPFPKFWNWDQSGAPFPPTGPCLRMPKMDGSLGILYPVWEEKWNGGQGGKFLTDWRIATRGSMHSEQAEWATNFFNHEMDVRAEFLSPHKAFRPRIDKTYLFEIIYPENRIVVDYGEYEGLVLIDVIDIATGLSDTDEFDNCKWPDKVTRVPVAGFDSGQDQEIPDGDEGFVYLWPVRNFRTKMKAAEYVRIHRLVSGLTAKSIWQHLVKGGTLEELKRDLPEEFHTFIDAEGEKIQSNAFSIVVEVHNVIRELEHSLNGLFDQLARKDVALWMTKNYPALSKYVFCLLDGKPIYPVALAASKPQREVSAVQEV